MLNTISSQLNYFEMWNKQIHLQKVLFVHLIENLDCLNEMILHIVFVLYDLWNILSIWICLIVIL